ncbi:MAG: hypothetical protein AAF125_19180 [Chloroflexota bacterium]
MGNMPTSENRGAGGTSGGIGEFFFGLMMVIGGGYLFLQQVQVRSAGFYFRFGGFEVDSFGLSLLPLLVGIGFLFFRGRSLVGWFLTIAGSVIIVLGVISNLGIYFRPTSLFNTLVMLGLIAGGIGLVARAIQPHNTQ